MAITKIDVTVSGFTGGPAMNVWYFMNASFAPMSDAEINGALADVRTFYAGIAANYTSTTSIQVVSPCAIIDEDSGDLLGMGGTSTPAVVPGTTGAGFGPPQVAILARLNTGVVVDGRILKGRVYLGPFQTAVTAGSAPGAPTVAGIQTPLTTLIGTPGGTYNVAVWHRPRPASTAHPLPRAGTAVPVVSGTVGTSWATQRRRLT